jgi:F0F1-type ATP synthase assembly protein I
MGWELVVPIGAGAVVGHLLHQRYHTGVVVTLVLLLLGVVVGYYNLLRLIRRATKRNDCQAQHNRGGAL